MIRSAVHHLAVSTLAAALLVTALPAAVTAADQAPDVSTGTINSIDRTDATFTGSINPHGTATTYVFQYGKTTGYGASTTVSSAGSGTSSTSVSKQVGGLTPGTTYHVRLVATNGGGTVNGVDRSFTTDKPAAVAAPAVSTGGVKSVTQATATLTATVNARGSATTYHFEYGVTTGYGANTAEASAGSGSKGVGVAAGIGGLPGATRIHYRVVATGPGGVTRGADRSFVTSRIPNALSIGTLPAVAKFSGTALIAGTLTGTGNVGAKVQLQGRGFPFSTAFANIGNQQVTDGAGKYAFTFGPLGINSQFRVIALTSPNVTSPVASIGVKVISTIHVSTAHPKKGHQIKVFGSIQPAKPGAVISYQRKADTGRYVTIKRGVSEALNSARSTYSTHITIRGKRRIRVLVRPTDGANLPGTSVVRDISVR